MNNNNKINNHVELSDYDLPFDETADEKIGPCVLTKAPFADYVWLKCKPTYNFQSIEFEIACPIDDLSEMWELYNTVLAGLMTIAPEQTKIVAEKVQVEPASPKQLDILDRYRIKYDPNISKDEASELIRKSMSKNV